MRAAKQTLIKRERVLAHAPERAVIRCSIADRLLQEFAVPAVFFYDRKLDADDLAHALGKVLGSYAPFNAVMRERKGELLIDSNNVGVEFSVVERNDTMLDAMQGVLGHERANLVGVSHPGRAFRMKAPVQTVRVTHFADGRSSLGVCWQHSVGDMHSFMMLMRAWTQAANSRPFESPVIVEDRQAYWDRALTHYNGAQPALRVLGLREIARLGGYLLTEGRRKRTVAIYFTPEEVTAMRHAFRAETGEQLTVNDVLNAHMIALSSKYDIRPRARQLATVVNYRRRVGLPAGLLGNAVTGLYTRCEPSDTAPEIAGRLRRSLNSFAEHHLDYSANDTFVRRHGTRNMRRYLPAAIDPVRGNLMVTNWSNFGVYEMGFGAAQPVYFASVADAPIPWLSWIFEGFGGRGSMFLAELPTAVADGLSSQEGARAVHQYRPPDAVVPDLARQLAWVQ